MGHTMFNSESTDGLTSNGVEFKVGGCARARDGRIMIKFDFKMNEGEKEGDGMTQNDVTNLENFYLYERI